MSFVEIWGTCNIDLGGWTYLHKTFHFRTPNPGTKASPFGTLQPMKAFHSGTPLTLSTVKRPLGPPSALDAHDGPLLSLRKHRHEKTNVQFTLWFTTSQNCPRSTLKFFSRRNGDDDKVRHASFWVVRLRTSSTPLLDSAEGPAWRRVTAARRLALCLCPGQCRSPRHEKLSKFESSMSCQVSTKFQW